MHHGKIPHRQHWHCLVRICHIIITKGSYIFNLVFLLKYICKKVFLTQFIAWELFLRSKSYDPYSNKPKNQLNSYNNLDTSLSKIIKIMLKLINHKYSLLWPSDSCSAPLRKITRYFYFVCGRSDFVSSRFAVVFCNIELILFVSMTSQ